MFDDFLRKTADTTGARFTPFDIHDDYDEYVDGKPREDGVRDFLASRGITLPEGTPDDPPAAETIYGLGNRKNELLLKQISEHGVEVYDGSVRYLEAVQKAGLHRAVVSSSANTKQVLEVTGLAHFFELRVDGVTSPSSTCTASPLPTPTWTARARARRRARPRGRVRGRPVRGGLRARRPLRLRGRGGPGRAGRRRWPSTGPTGSSRTWPSCSTTTSAAQQPVIPHPGLRGRPVDAAREPPGPGPAGPDRVGLRAGQRPHRGARQPGRGRAARAARHLPERRSTRPGRCPTPRPATATPRPGRPW